MAGGFWVLSMFSSSFSQMPHTPAHRTRVPFFPIVICREDEAMTTVAEIILFYLVTRLLEILKYCTLLSHNRT